MAWLNMFVMRVTASVFHLSPLVGMAWLNAVASLNMELMSVTAAVSKVEMSLLNAVAPSNMEAMSSTRVVHQTPPPASLISLLNSFAPLNMEFMFFTFSVFQLTMLPPFLPKRMAPLNMFAMSVTLAVFQSSVFAVGMSLSNAFAPLNMEFMVNTSVVCQPLMS